MILGQRDEMISEKLQEKHLSHGIKILGSSNGLIWDDQYLGKNYLYINCFMESNIFKLELCFIKLDAKQDNDKVTRIPLIYSQQIRGFQQTSMIKMAKIQITPSPHDPNLLAVRISTWNQNLENLQTDNSSQSRNDTISLLLLDGEQLKNQWGKLQKDKKLKSEKDACYIELVEMGGSLSCKCIQDYKWYPFGENILMVLYHNETFQIWNVGIHTSIPNRTIKLKLYKRTKSTIDNGIFTSFNFIESKQSKTSFNFNRFTLYLMNSDGIIYSLSPFILPGTIIPNQILNQLEKQNYKQNSLFSCLREIILEESIINKQFPQEGVIKELQATIIQCPDINQFIEMQVWRNSKKQQVLSYHYNLKFKSLKQPDFTLVTYLKSRKPQKKSQSIAIGMMTEQIKIDDNAENYLFQIHEIKLPGIQYPFEQLENINKTIHQKLFIVNGTDIFQIDLCNFLVFVENGNSDIFSKPNAFPQELVLRLPNRQQIVSMIFQLAENKIYLIRKTTNSIASKHQKISFEILSLQYLNMFHEVDNFQQQFKKIHQKLQNQLQKNRIVQVKGEKPEDTSFKFEKEKLEKNEREGVKLFEKQYKDYCSHLKNKIDLRMNHAKSRVEQLQSQITKYQKIKRKKNELLELMTIIQENKKRIAEMLGSKPTAARFQNTLSAEVVEYEKKLHSIRNIYQALQTKQISIDQNILGSQEKIVDKMLFDLKQLKVQINTIKQLKEKNKDQMNN